MPLFVKARCAKASPWQAKAAMDVLGRRLEAEYPDVFAARASSPGPGITVVPSTDVRIHPQADVPFMAIASLVLVIVGLVLAIACSNLATLLLVRGAARAKEVSVRLAMGATRRQLVRHLLTESLLLSLAGGIAGCVLAWWGMQALQGIDLPFRVDLTLDYRVLAFAIALSLVTGVRSAWRRRSRPRGSISCDAARRGAAADRSSAAHLKNALIVFQVAVSVLLLGGTSIFLRCCRRRERSRRLCRRRRGDARDRLRFAGYSETDGEDRVDDLLRRIRAIPGVESAALLRGLPMGQWRADRR